MNNLTFGGQNEQGSFAYYETMGGGLGAGPQADGGHAMHAHMSNTLNTPVEALEYAYPLRVTQYSLRTGSGGPGQHPGGDGLVRAIQFLQPVTATITSERRAQPPYGLQGARPGQCGRNTLIRQGEEQELPGKTTLDLQAGDILRIATPGGGGWGAA